MAEPHALPEGKLLCHYTSASKLAMILHSGRLRLGPFSNTRDPRENKNWHPSVAVPEDVKDKWPTGSTLDLIEPLNAAMRLRAKLTCLTLDKRDPDDPILDLFARGFGRARMWEQYADQHRGAVLVFGHSALDAAVGRELRGRGPLFTGAVTYSDEPWGRFLTLQFNARDLVQPDGVKKAANQAVAENPRLLFFHKNADWSTEQEYRYVILTDAPYEEVDVADSLVGIVLGEEYPAYEENVLRYRLEKRGILDLPILKMGWSDSLPYAFPTILT